GDQLLAGPGLAEYEHSVVERRHLAHHLHYIAQPRIAADDPVCGVTMQLPVQEALVVQQYSLVAEHLLVSEGIGQGNRKRLRKAAGELKKFFVVASLSRCLQSQPPDQLLPDAQRNDQVRVPFDFQRWRQRAKNLILFNVHDKWL